MKGHIAWNKGLHIQTNTGRTHFKKGYNHTEEYKEKMSERMKGNTYGFKKGHKVCLGRSHIAWNKGLKGYKINRNHPNKRNWTKEEIKKMLKRRTPSSLEQKMIEIITKLQLPYKFVGNGQFFIERKNPDFININGEKIAVEVFYRDHKEQFSNGLENWKQKRQEIFNKYGWKIIFLDETQVYESEINNLQRRGLL